MRLSIKHDWGTSIEAGLIHYILVGVEGAPADSMLVQVDDRVHKRFIATAGEAVQNLTERFFLTLLHRLTALGEEGFAELLQTANGRLGYRLDLDIVDPDEPKRLSSRKHCRYQHAEGGDLYCTAGAGAGDVRVGPAPTTRYDCNGCSMPDSRVACAHLHHARVGHLDGSPPSLDMAVCDVGRGEVGQPDKCRPGGHKCWTCEVPIPEYASVEMSPLALHENLDFLDAVWRNVFGEHLLHVRAAAVAAKLATPCDSQQDFEVKLSALADMLNSFEVSDALLVEADKTSKDFEKGRTLARVTSALRRRFANEEDGPAMEEAARRHIGVLRDAIGLRRGYQHTGANAAGRLPEMFGRFGLSYPPTAPTEAWARVRSRVVSSLGALRDLVRELER